MQASGNRLLRARGQVELVVEPAQPATGWRRHLGELPRGRIQLRPEGAVPQPPVRPVSSRELRENELNLDLLHPQRSGPRDFCDLRQDCANTQSVCRISTSRIVVFS